MPSIATQTSPPSTPKIVHLGGLPTPPASNRSASASSSRSSSASSTLHSPARPYPSSEDVFMQGSRATPARVRVRGAKGRTPPIHIHFENIHFHQAGSSVERPAMVDAAVQVGDPQIPERNPNSFMNRMKRWLRPLRPVFNLICVVGLFLLERVGFGIRLN